MSACIGNALEIRGETLQSTLRERLMIFKEWGSDVTHSEQKEQTKLVVGV